MGQGDPAAHMQDVLAGFGMLLDPRELQAPDHLAVLLEFLAFLIDNCHREEVESFCRDHLDWLDALREEAERKGIESVLISLIRTAERLVQSVVS